MKFPMVGCPASFTAALVAVVLIAVLVVPMTVVVLGAVAQTAEDLAVRDRLIPPTTPAGAFTALSTGHRIPHGLRADQTIAYWGNNCLGRSDAPARAFMRRGQRGARATRDARLGDRGFERDLAHMPQNWPGEYTLNHGAAAAGRFTEANSSKGRI